MVTMNGWKKMNNSPKWWCFMVMNPMVESKSHQQNNFEYNNILNTARIDQQNVFKSWYKQKKNHACKWV